MLPANPDQQQVAVRQLGVRAQILTTTILLSAQLTKATSLLSSFRFRRGAFVGRRGGTELNSDEQDKSRQDAGQSETKHFHIETSDFYRSLSEKGRLESPSCLLKRVGITSTRLRGGRNQERAGKLMSTINLAEIVVLNAHGREPRFALGRASDGGDKLARPRAATPATISAGDWRDATMRSSWRLRLTSLPASDAARKPHSPDR